LAALDQLALVLLERGQAADPGPDHAADPVRLVGQLGLGAERLGDRLLGGGDRHLREAVGAARLLLREEVERIEIEAAAAAVGDPALARRPALDQRLGADPERGDRTDSGDDYAARHPALLTTRSMTSPTVFTSLTSSPRSSTPNSSSTIWASSTRSSESMS